MLIPLGLSRLAWIAQSFLRLCLLLISLFPISSWALILLGCSMISSLSMPLIILSHSRIACLTNGYEISTSSSLPWCLLMKLFLKMRAYGWVPLDQSCLTKPASGLSSIQASRTQTFRSRLSFVLTPVALL